MGGFPSVRGQVALAPELLNAWLRAEPLSYFFLEVCIGVIVFVVIATLLRVALAELTQTR